MHTERDIAQDPAIESPEDETTTVPDWDRHQMGSDSEEPGPNPPAPDHGPEEEGSSWNLGQMAPEFEDGGGPRVAPVDADPGSGPSGLGANDGGGERWAQRDDEV